MRVCVCAHQQSIPYSFFSTYFVGPDFIMHITYATRPLKTELVIQMIPV